MSTLCPVLKKPTISTVIKINSRKIFSCRRTKIVATIGPACESEKNLKALILAGADILRINTSHTSPEGLRYWMDRIRAVSSCLEKDVAILVDLQGPRIRTGTLKEGKALLLRKGDILTITPSDMPGLIQEKIQITTPCRGFPAMVKKNDSILIDNGLIHLRVLRSEKKEVQCKVISGGLLGQNKGINLPSVPMTLPALTGKDREILQIAAEMDADYVALSFVRTAQDVLTVKKVLSKYGKSIPVISKIEKPKAVEEIGSIMEVSNGIMIARGDLGIEMGVDKVPIIQKQLIERANQRNIGVITATQMLESMIKNAQPSRAEASDIANAVFDGTDAVMLSGETSIGKYPVETVRMMAKIILEAEKHQALEGGKPRKTYQRHDHPICAITHAAQDAAYDLNAKAIVAFTTSGETAVLVSKFERNLPIIALTPSREISRRLTLFRGIISIRIDYCPSTDEMLQRAHQAILNSKLLKNGDAVVMLVGGRALPGSKYMVKIDWLKQASK